MDSPRMSENQDYGFNTYNNMAFVSGEDTPNASDNDPGLGSESGEESIEDEDIFNYNSKNPLKIRLTD